MRLETTMSHSGPVPRSHSPLDCVRLSRFIGGFLLLDRIAQSGSLLVSLRLDRLPKRLTQLAQLAGAGGVPCSVWRYLAPVAGAPMDAFQERQERSTEYGVIVRAT